MGFIELIVLIFTLIQMSYSPAGRWVSERMSSATPSETDPSSPKPGYGKSSTRFTAPLGMPQNYDDEDYEDYEHHDRSTAGFHGGKPKGLQLFIWKRRERDVTSFI